MSDAVYMRRHASNLLNMAMEAFQTGDSALGDDLTARAIEYLEDAKAADAAAQAPLASTEPPQPTAQQQQQVQPKRGDGTN